jgi:Aspartyl/Asparaginyl beta-hydroxylase
VPHPDRLPGNHAAQLIGPGGVETESLHGEMLATRWLAKMPYVRQILAGLGVVWSHSRLMRLAPGAEVPDHADINHHWHTRVRLHIPMVTWPEVRFHCSGEAVHMAAGEAWNLFHIGQLPLFGALHPYRFRVPVERGEARRVPTSAATPLLVISSDDDD